MNLSVYDVSGRMVREVVNEVQPAGVYQAAWDGKERDGRTASSGIYFVRLSSPTINKAARFVVVH